MSSNYTSFLICFHNDHTEVYVEGLPQGIIRNGVFQVHEYVLPDGSRKPVVLNQETLNAVQAVLNRINTYHESKQS